MNISGVRTTASYSPATGAGAAATPGKTLTSEEQALVQSLKQRDQEVRQHEQAHVSAGAGIVTSGASFTYQKGPDGANYAIGGEVGIDTSPGKTPDETIAKAQKIRSAALAPSDPSGQDQAVARQASQMEQQAQSEKAALARAYGSSPTPPGSSLNVYA